MSKRFVIYVMCLAMLNLGSPLVARAELVGTLQAVQASTRAQDLATVNSALARAEVRAQFAALGVEPAQVDALAGDFHCGPADVEVHDLGVEPAQLLGQEHGAVAGAAAGHEHAEAVVEAASAAKAVVIDHA